MSNKDAAVKAFIANRNLATIFNMILHGLIVGFGFIPMAQILWGIELPFWATFFTVLGLNVTLGKLSGAYAAHMGLLAEYEVKKALGGA